MGFKAEFETNSLREQFMTRRERRQQNTMVRRGLGSIGLILVSAPLAAIELSSDKPLRGVVAGAAFVAGVKWFNQNVEQTDAMDEVVDTRIMEVQQLVATTLPLENPPVS